MRTHLFLGLSSLLFCALSHAQVVYQPVQSQYRTEHGTYYYGGSNPVVHERARHALDCFYDAGSGRPGVYGVGSVHRDLISRPPQYVISDCAPYVNASVYGYTSVNARNEAYARVPRFFRMDALFASARPADDGIGYVVPAQAQGTVMIRASGSAAPATSPATQPKAILIIPKKRPAATVTDAR